VFKSDSNARIALSLGIGVALVYLALLPPQVNSPDAEAMVKVAESLVIDGSLTVPEELGLLAPDGRYYSKWYPLLSFLAVPFVALGLAVAGIAGLPGHYVAVACALALTALVIGATTSLVALLVLRLGGTRKGACLAALGFAFGTFTVAYARTFFAEPLLALLTIGSLYLALGDKKKEVIGTGLVTALAVLAKPTGVIVGPILSAYLLLKKRPLKHVVVPTLGTLVGIGLYGVYNYIRFKNPTVTGQPANFRISAIPTGILGLLVSPGRGLVWYCPPVILSVIGLRGAWRSKKLESLAIIAVFLGYLLIHSYRVRWFGGWSWGPRYIFPALPLLIVLAGMVERRWRKLLVTLCIVGFIVNSPTIVAFYQRYYAESHERGIPEKALHWAPSRSPLLHVWGASSRQVRDALDSDVRDLIREAGKPGKTMTGRPTLRVVALWWWMLPAAGIPRWIGASFAFFVLAIGVWTIRRAMRFARE